MILPFSFTYTIINNILTIVFDFSKLDEHQFNKVGGLGAAAVVLKRAAEGGQP